MTAARPMRDPGPADATAALAREMVALGDDRLSPDDRRQTERLLFDHLACALRGADLSWSRALRDAARRYAGTGNAPLFGAPMRVAPPVAAFLNGSAAHGLELDDTHDESVSHPGAVVISAALAVGADRGSPGARVLAAIVAGYETMARVGMAVGAAPLIERGFHPTALFGTFGATTAAGLLMGLDADGLSSAWGLALSQASGSMQFSDEPAGTDVKRLHAGYAAQHGVEAAERAAAGLSGPRRALDGRYGALALFGEAPDPAPLWPRPGWPREIHRISIKFYPCCRLFHSTLDALAEASENFRLSPDAVAGIRVGGPAIIEAQHMLRRPGSTMAAQYALPFTLATAFFHDARDPAAFGAAAREDARIAALADRVEAFVEAEHEAAFPRHFGSSVTLRLTDGRERRVSVRDSVGTPVRPPSDAALAAKMAALLGETPFAAACADAPRRVAALAVGADAGDFFAGLPHG